MKVKKYVKDMKCQDFTERFVDLARTMPACERCGAYGKRWSCPPFDFDPMTIWQSYKYINIYGRQIWPEEDATDMKGIFYKEKEEMLLDMEGDAEAYGESMILVAGCCDVCEKCTRSKGQPCRKPELCRHSMESIGGDAEKTSKEIFGVSMLWSRDGRHPEYYMLITALLHN